MSNGKGTRIPAVPEELLAAVREGDMHAEELLVEHLLSWAAGDAQRLRAVAGIDPAVARLVESLGLRERVGP